MTYVEPTPRVWPWHDETNVVLSAGPGRVSSDDPPDDWTPPRPVGFALGVTTAEVDAGAQQLKDALARLRDDLEHTCRVRRCTGTLASHVAALYVAGVDEQAQEFLEPTPTPYLGRHRRYVVTVEKWPTEAAVEHADQQLDQLEPWTDRTVVDWWLETYDRTPTLAELGHVATIMRMTNAELLDQLEHEQLSIADSAVRYRLRRVLDVTPE